MAKFDESKVISPLHPEKAEIGKKYYCSDHLLIIKRYVEEDDTRFIGELKKIEVASYGCIFQLVKGSTWQFLYPYEEPPKQRMTNIQLMEWVSKGNGMYSKMNSLAVNLSVIGGKDFLNEEVDEDIVIRSWDSDEWVEPTTDIYERDCKKED